MDANGTARATARQASIAWALPALLVAGLLLRVLYIGNEGFKTDVSTYMSWALSLSERPFASFYSTVGFADYPPGYFYILAVVGHFWHAFFASRDHGFAVLRVLVKVPAILADLGIGVLLYAVVRRFASTGYALGAAALYLLNPATIYISAAWGQVDSVAGGLALLAIYALLRSSDEAPQSRAQLIWIVGAWLAFGYSLLIKPQAAVLLPLLVAFAFVDPKRRRERVVATVAGVAAAVILALLVAEPFHRGNPVAALHWLWDRYAYGAGVYQYNSVNAFNLWALRGTMWVPDNQYILLLPQSLWGLLLVSAAVALVVWRYIQDRTDQSLLEGCAVATLAFFVLATRMHERYLFNGLLFTIACLPFARRYLWGAVALSVALFANLIYSLQYLLVVTHNVPGTNAQNLWGLGTTFFSAVVVLTFFWLGYCYLGSGEAAAVSAPAKERPSAGEAAASTTGARYWFDPTEGLTALRAPLDYVIIAIFGVGNFILSFIGYWYPTEKVFDEIYFARAGEEYLQNLRIYENTHPPLSKLLITLSIALFGGMPHGHGLGGWTGLNALIGHLGNGDNSYGWRFLDVVFGALVVMLLYVFAKRITGSTLFATIAALLLTFDGMHFVQSRIATPEGFVVFFATLATYAFYRFWISSQVGERAQIAFPAWYLAGIPIALAAGAIVGQIGRLALGLDIATTTIVSVYFAAVSYLVLQYFVMPRFFGSGRSELTYAEGSYALRGAQSTTLYTADGGSIDSKGKMQRGAVSQNKGGSLVYEDDPLTIEYRRDAGINYETPAGEASYAGNEIRTETVIEPGRSAKLWLVLFTIALGLLVASKWYGVMGFGVSFAVLIAVWLQRYFLAGRPTLWGNPRGFRLGGALAAIVVVSATVYAMAWVPDLARHSSDPNEIHNLNDVVSRQKSMYDYHHNLKATHPYSSKPWEWPVDWVPIAYYYQDRRKDQSDPNGCCVYEITSLPNPVIMWFGLICVPWVAFLAWRERNKAYALIVLTYLLQWLPWIPSPRLTFAYHFYVDIPLICLCNVILLQRFLRWARARDLRWAGWLGVGSYVAAAGAAFVFFYPILAAHPLSWSAWHHRMWFPTWIIGPG